MANLRICGANVVDDDRCTLTCSVADILPVENLQDISRGKILRVAVGASNEIKGTYGGEDVAITFVSLIRHNMTGDGTFRLQGYSDPAWTTQVIDTGTRSAVPTAMLDEIDFGIGEIGVNVFSPTYREKRTTVWFDDADMVANSTEVVQSWKVTFGDTDGSLDYLDASRLWLGEHYELEDNPAYGSALGYMDESVTWRTDGGGSRTDAALPYRGGKLDLQLLPEVDRRYLTALSHFCGAGRRTFFASWFPDLLADDAEPKLTAAHEGEFICKSPLPQFVHVDSMTAGRFNASLSIEEV